MKRLFAVILVVVFALIVIAANYILGPFIPAKTLPVKTSDPWILQSNNPANKYGTYLGSGRIGARIGPTGVGWIDGKPTDCFMMGIYQDEKIIPLPQWSDFPIYDERGRRFQIDRRSPYRQTLNMREGYVRTELTLRSGLQKLTGEVTFFISKSENPLAYDVAAISYRLKPKFSGKVFLDYALGSASEWKNVVLAQTIPGGSEFVGRTKEGQGVIVCASVRDADGGIVDHEVELRRGREIVLTKWVAFGDASGCAPTLDRRRPYTAWVTTGDMLEAARGRLEAASKAGFAKVFAEHKKAWRQQWASDIIIEGDPEAQQAVHAMMFYLLSSASPGWSIPPTGLSSAGWSGHIFWDADIWMFPALMLQHPDEAYGIIRYRIRTLPGAIENAQKRGLAGAEYAWESALTGRETIGMPFSEERHITADVAIAANSVFYQRPQAPQYWSDVRESDALAILTRTADYWASRASYNKAKDRFEILKVMPPDEDAGIINNSVYTNAAAKRNLELAVAALKKAGLSAPRKWREIADKMYIPFDEQNRRFIAYDGYSGRQTKQADTELLIYPLAYPMPKDVKQKTFDYYKHKTDPRGPAMTSSIHAIIAAELDRRDEAYKHFTESFKPFMRGEFLMFNEKRSKTYENMCFLTGCGGVLQSVIYGFAGLRIGNKPEGFEQILPNLYIKPCMPKRWKKLTITNIYWQGKRYDLEILSNNKWIMRERR